MTLAQPRDPLTIPRHNLRLVAKGRGEATQWTTTFRGWHLRFKRDARGRWLAFANGQPVRVDGGLLVETTLTEAVRWARVALGDEELRRWP